MKSTPNRLLTIQRAQIAYYRQSVGRKGIKTIHAWTKLPNVHPDLEEWISTIGPGIPRGGNFETLLGKRPSQWHTESNIAWSRAIQDGKDWTR